MTIEPNFRIISIDPGGTTGWSTYSAYMTLVDVLEYQDEQWTCGQMGPKDHHSDLYAFLERGQVKTTIVVAERFDFRGDDRPDIDLMAREYMGIINLYSQERGVDVVWQWPFEGVGRRSLVQPDNLRSMGLWVTGGGSAWIHAMDSYRHLLYYMTAKSNPWISMAKRSELLKRMGK